MEVMENGLRKSKLFQMMKRIRSRKEKEKQEQRKRAEALAWCLGGGGARISYTWGSTVIAVDCFWVGEMKDTNLIVEEEISKEVQSIGQGRRPAVEVGSVRETPINCQAKKVTR